MRQKEGRFVSSIYIAGQRLGRYCQRSIDDGMSSTLPRLLAHDASPEIGTEGSRKRRASRSLAALPAICLSESDAAIRLQKRLRTGRHGGASVAPSAFSESDSEGQIVAESPRGFAVQRPPDEAARRWQPAVPAAAQQIAVREAVQPPSLFQVASTRRRRQRSDSS